MIATTMLRWTMVVVVRRVVVRRVVGVEWRVERRVERRVVSGVESRGW